LCDAGLFYAKKMRTQGPQKFTLALVISSMRETLKRTVASRVKGVPFRFCGALLNRKLDRDNRSLLCYLSLRTIVAMEDE
ncbi:hypothetical protein, partial [Citrobacter portucalensis]